MKTKDYKLIDTSEEVLMLYKPKITVQKIILENTGECE